MSKKVLIIENEAPQRIALHDFLEGLGFEVYSAGTAREARRLCELHWKSLAVAILDMELDDPEEPKTTGADVAMEFRRRFGLASPECLIYSHKNEIQFYRLALQLGAAAYLIKVESNINVVGQHTRVLALRETLNGPRIAAEVVRIASQSRTKSDAIATFCRNVLKQEFDACLGAPFVILFTDGNETKNTGDNIGLPEGHSAFYQTLQALAHGRGNQAEPFILESTKLEPPFDEQTARLYDRFDKAAFLPLSVSNNLQLSIGILTKEAEERELSARTAAELCGILAQYLRPTVIENMLTIWAHWTELRATRTSMAKLCLSVGQDIYSCVEAEDLEELDSMATDLNDTGQYLGQLDSVRQTDAQDAVSVKDVVLEAWKWVAPTGGQDVKLEVQNDCSVNVRRTDMEIIISRLLQWFVYRSKFTPFDIAPVIDIVCEKTDADAAITLEDASQRLPQALRDDLFAPFTQAISTPFAHIWDTKLRAQAAVDGQATAPSYRGTGRYLPLYLAKMIVEGRYQGSLQDQSNQIAGRNYGHRIQMQFPLNRIH